MSIKLLLAATAGSLISGGAKQAGVSGSLPNLVKTITSALMWLIGSVSVIMIIFGGVQMVISQGDPAKFKTARLTITYSVMGLIVAIASYAIVSFVIDNIK